MSETVSNAEIEDVLSSIRRLVSENARPDRKGEDARETTPGRLVLTPDFRVHDPDGAAVGADTPTDAESAESQGDGWQVEAEDEAASAPDDAQEHAAAEDPAWDADDEAGPDITDQGRVDAEEAVQDGTWQDAGAAEGDEDRDWQDQTAAAPDQPLDAAVTDLADERPADEMQRDPGETGDAFWQHDDNPEPRDHQAQTLEERVAELEAAIGDGFDEFEPDGSEARDLSPPQVAFFEHYARQHQADTPPPQSDQPQAAAGPEAELDQPRIDPAEPQEEAWAEAQHMASSPPVPDGPEQDADGMFGAAEEDVVIDEDALRDLVRRLVRDELQGEVGERITRNVRRLVRREIQRAITLRDFD